MTHLQIAVRSLASPVGRVVENEDNYLVVGQDGHYRTLKDQQPFVGQVDGWSVGHQRMAVLDGLGGHAIGRLVSERVVAGLLSMPTCHDQASLNSALETLHREVQTEFQHAARAPGATMLLIEVPASGPAFLFHVGDSRLFGMQKGELELLTVDHSPPTAYALRGEIGEREWVMQTLEERRSLISQAFGVGNSLADPNVQSDALYALDAYRLPPYLEHLPDRRALHFKQGETYLLATDGLWSYRSPMQSLSSLMRDSLAGGGGADQMADRLMAAHVEASKTEQHHDNTTVIVVSVA